MEEEQKNNFEEMENQPAEAEFASVKKIPARDLRQEIGDEENEMDLSEENEGQLTVDVYQTPDEIVVQSTVAGVSPEDLEVNITNESVTIRGTRKKEEKIKEKDYFYQECFWGRFSRSIILPQEIDPDSAVAELKNNGILIVRMPKLHRQKAKKLKVRFE